MHSEKDMSLVEHLRDLRKKIVLCLIVIVLTLVGGLLAVNPILSYLKNAEPAKSIEWNAFSPFDAISIYMQCAILVSITVSMPFILYQLWDFVRPGLRVNEQKATIKYIPGAVFLFLLGAAFAYFIIFPMAFNFASSVSRNMGLNETYGISQYFTFMFNIITPMALLFELPVVVLFLTKLGILTPKRLKKMRKVSYLILVLIAALVTPPDFISDILVSIQMIILYEFSIILSSRVHRKHQAEERALDSGLDIA